MIRYIAFFDRMRNQYCSDLIPVDDDTGAVTLRLAKRFTFNSYCKFVDPKEIECRLIAKWDSVSKGLIPEKNPVDSAFTLDKCDELYAVIAKKLKVDDVQTITMPEVTTNKEYGDFRREVEKQKNSEVTINEE